MNESAQDIYTLQIRRQIIPHSGSPYCNGCKNGFVHVNSLQVRQFTQTGKLPGVCKSCNDAFLKICRLQIRHLSQMEPNPHNCVHCGKTFTHAGNYRKHVLLHEQKRLAGEEDPNIDNCLPKPPYDCEKCARSFLKYGSFLKHCQNHDIIKVFTCHICEKNYKSKAILKAHLRIHTVEANFYSCKLCKMKFTAPEDLEDHLLRHVDEQNKCINEGNGMGHMKMGDKVEKNVTEVNCGGKRYNHYCTICQRGFVHLGALKNHSLLHTGNVDYECKVCQQKFIHEFHLKKHSKVHEKKDGSKSDDALEVESNSSGKGEINPPTEILDVNLIKQEGDLEKVDNEVEIKSNETVVVQKNGKKKTKHFCSICKKGFINIGSLEKHYSLHSGKLAFKCRKCTKVFVHAGHFKKHLKTHPPEVQKPTYTCKKCKKVYKSRKVFKKHLATHK